MGGGRHFAPAQDRRLATINGRYWGVVPRGAVVNACRQTRARAARTTPCAHWRLGPVIVRNQRLWLKRVHNGNDLRNHKRGGVLVDDLVCGRHVLLSLLIE